MPVLYSQHSRPGRTAQTLLRVLLVEYKMCYKLNWEEDVSDWYRSHAVLVMEKRVEIYRGALVAVLLNYEEWLRMNENCSDVLPFS